MVEASADTAEPTSANAQPAQDPLTHIPILDSVRGVAILSVMLFHATAFTMNGSTLFPDRLYWNIMESGWSGVDLFFVLSGFLITRILLNTKTQEDYFRNFYARRLLRIFPLYYLAVIGYLAFAQILHLPSAHAAAPWLLTYTSNLIGTVGPSVIVPLPTAHFWSLAIEEQFYLLWPLVVLMLSNRNLLRASAAVIVLAVVIRVSMVLAGNTFGAYRFTLCRLDSLVLGGVVAVLMTSPNRARLRGWCWAVFGLSGAGLTAIAIWRGDFEPEDGMVIEYGISALAIFFAAGLFLLVSHPGGLPAAGCVNRALAHCGRYAYGMYVVHQPLATAVIRIKGARALPLIFGSQIPFEIGFSVVYSVCTLLIAMLSFHFFERRFLRLKKYFKYAHRAARSPAPRARNH